MIMGSELIQRSSVDVGWLIQELIVEGCWLIEKLIVNVRSFAFVALVRLDAKLGFKERWRGRG